MKCDRSVVLRKWTPTCLMLVSLLMLLVPGAWVSRFKGTVLTVVGPIDALVADSLQGLSRLPGRLANDPESSRRVRELQNRLAAVESERDAALVHAAELQRQIDSVQEARQVLGNDAQYVATPVQIIEKPARVRAVHEGLRGTLLIEGGRIGGIKEGDPVVFAKYVVGRVIATGLDTSQIELVTDPGFRAAAFLHPSGVEGTVQGEAGSHCIMKHVLQTDRVSEGELVVTSGFAGVFPRGFIVGRVSKVTSVYDARFQRVEIAPAIMADRLESVLVLSKKVPDGP